MDKKVVKILVADDDTFVREMLGEILESGGFKVVSAKNGSEALDQYYADSGIDLIVSDMNMPELNGLELIKELRKAQKNIPVIILTANNEIKVAIEAMKTGADDYLLKDENIQDTIIISVEKVMEQHRLRVLNQKLMADLEEKNIQLERMAFMDGLTGIPNRRYFDDFSEQEWGRAMRDATPLSAIMMDIDFFKAYNDTYGHQKGDDCLKQVAKALKDALGRPADFVSRYGGEEFVAILPNTDLNGADIVAEIMRSNVFTLKIPHEKSKAAHYVTVSMGVGSMIPQRNSAISELIAKADKALYSAKQKGRNQIVNAE